jgi:S1-C subfamily serine protease
MRLRQPVALVRIFLLALAPLLLALPGQAQLTKELINNQGASAPCTGIELGLGLIKKCIDTVAAAGFIRVPEVGVSGLTLGATPGDDDQITAIAPGSAAEQAGLHVGDAIVAVEGKPIAVTPGVLAEQAIFGPRGEELHLKLLRAGTPMEVTLKRAPLAPPKGPKSPSFLFIMHPLLDWRGVMIPCMGGGLAAPAVFLYCDKHYRPYGYIPFGELGTTGLQFDVARRDAAQVSAVDAGSPAAAAGVQTGDVVVAVEGKPLQPNLSELAREQLFGKAGAAFHVTVRSGGAEKTVVLTLAAKPKD